MQLVAGSQRVTQHSVTGCHGPGVAIHVEVTGGRVTAGDPTFGHRLSRPSVTVGGPGVAARVEATGAQWSGVEVTGGRVTVGARGERPHRRQGQAGARRPDFPVLVSAASFRSCG